MQEDERICLACGEALKGRTDKKFCDDNCRNLHNNKQNADHNNFVRRINNALRRNRRILESAIPAGEEMGKCPRIKLSHAGFDFRFHTHQYTNKKGNVYFFCYEYGYLPIEGEWVLVVRRKETFL